jgi:hypothetical protein
MSRGDLVAGEEWRGELGLGGSGWPQKASPTGVEWMVERVTGWLEARVNGAG